ncbi:MAG: type IV pilin-like G/H family protein [Elusimicrobiota bacterium]|nr:type IV pilin-like G/H family protein [Elusimicrobiota bacterium]
MKEGLLYIKYLEQAENLYRLQYGSYTSNLANLGLDLPPTTNWTYSVLVQGDTARIDMINQQRTIYIEYEVARRRYKCNSKKSARMCLLSEVVKDCGERVSGEWEYHCQHK